MPGNGGWRIRDDTPSYRFVSSGDSTSDITFDSFEVNTDTSNISIEPEMIRDVEIKLSTKADKLNTTKTSKMETNSIESWFVEKALELFSKDEIGPTVAEFGFAGLRQSVLADGAVRMAEERSGSGDEVRAFNQVTMEWPHEARGYMAAYEHRFNHETSDTYDDQTLNFAEACGVEDYAVMQSTLDTFFEGNPYNDPTLSDAEASAVIYLRANDEDTSIVREVDSPENFIGWYKKLGNVDAARRASQFDANAPEEITPHLAPPEEWDELNPNNIREETCLNCNTTVYEVCHHEEGRCWIDAGSSIRTAEMAGPNHQFMSPTESIICGNCVDEWEQTAAIAVSYDGSDTYKYGSSMGIDRDWGHGDNDFTPIGRASITDRETITASPNRVPDGYFSLEPTLEAGSPEDFQRDALRNIEERLDEVFSDGVITVMTVPRYDDNDRWLLVPTDSPELAREAKEVLEDPEAVIA